MYKGYKKVMVIYRGTLKGLKESFEIAKKEGTWLVILIPLPIYKGELHLTGIKNIEDVLKGISYRELNKIKNLVQEERVLAKIRMEMVDNDEDILEIAKEENCDLIVLEPEKPSLWRKILHLKDHLLEKLIENSSCPILVVR